MKGFHLHTWPANKESLEASFLSEGNLVTASQKLAAIPQDFGLDARGLAVETGKTGAHGLEQHLTGRAFPRHLFLRSKVWGSETGKR